MHRQKLCKINLTGGNYETDKNEIQGNNGINSSTHNWGTSIGL